MVQLCMHDTGQSGISTFHFRWDRNTQEVQQATYPATNIPDFLHCIFPIDFGLHNFYEEDHVYIFIFWHGFLLQQRNRSTRSVLGLYYRKKPKIPKSTSRGKQRIFYQTRFLLELSDFEEPTLERFFSHSFPNQKPKQTLNCHERKEKNKPKLQTAPVFPLFPHTLEYCPPGSTKKTVTPYEITDETVGKYFTLLSSSNFLNFSEHDPK